MRHSMMIDLDRCVGCMACVSACKERWDSGQGAARDWVHTFEHGKRGDNLGLTFYPGLCMQCKDHPCTADCPTGATYMNDRGVVVVDPQVCIGCGNCITNCAYGARRADPQKGIVEKCNLCEPLVARGERPACVATCLAECRHFGDLDDPQGELVRLIAERGAKPLVTAEVDIRPQVTYAGEDHRRQILAQGVVTPPRSSWLTKAWTGLTLPLARTIVPLVGVAAIMGGLVVNLISRRERIQALAPHQGETIERHRAGMRFLHWFNALSWLVLVVTGTALMSAQSFALFGEALPRVMRDLLGGPGLLRLHVLWGLAWALIIVPVFLIFKGGGVEALREIRITREDMRWLMLKPLAMVGRARQPLPPQDKYNAGQKIFALTALVGTVLIIASGLVMTFHWGSADVVAAAIVVHKLAIALAIMGLAVHITMAAILRDERPALRSMVTGRIDKGHAKSHNARWVEGEERKDNGMEERRG